MCFFKYKETRYGRTALRLFALLCIILAGAAGFGGVYGFMHITHWARYVVISVAGLVALGLLALGVFSFSVSLSMIRSWKSGRDGNKSKGVSNVRLCDKCGKVISKKAVYCEHCGEKTYSGNGHKSLRVCPICKTKNSATASFCDQCGHEFKD